MRARTTFAEQDYDPYQLLRVYTYYRVLLGCLMLLIYRSELLSNILGSENPYVFSITCWLYTILALGSLIDLWRHKRHPSIQQRAFALVSDIIAITLMMYASGGATSGLGYLMIVSVAAAGMLLSAQLAIFMAALATIALIGESMVHHLVSGIDTRSLFVAGSLGALIFLTTLTFQYLTGKIRRSTAEIQSQAEHVAHLQKLARLIVERMRTGIIVLNKHDEIELINNAAQSLLDIKTSNELAITLDNLPAIQSQLKTWRTDQENRNNSIIVAGDKPRSEIKISLAHLELGKEEDTLVFIEDNRAITQQAQQLKLASLGRLTASIAHEIRNPLSAISHANQLLEESEDFSAADRRLLEIIRTHTARVNQIIENIMQVSRRRPASQINLELASWISDFVGELGTRANSISVSGPKKKLFAPFDPSQLHQIVSNLLDNAFRYADFNAPTPAIKILIGRSSDKDSTYLRITDNGPGIPAELQKNIFEPFFTTENSGSGLGLYICKELCEANQAFISYEHSLETGSCFTIHFAHPHKVQQ